MQSIPIHFRFRRDYVLCNNPDPKTHLDTRTINEVTCPVCIRLIKSLGFDMQQTGATI